MLYGLAFTAVFYLFGASNESLHSHRRFLPNDAMLAWYLQPYACLSLFESFVEIAEWIELIFGIEAFFNLPSTVL